MKYIIIHLLMLLCIYVSGQAKPEIYNPQANAAAEIANAIKKAKNSNKHVMIQVGGNWCPWCIKLHKTLHEDFQLDSALQNSYVYILVNYSKENKNTDVMKMLEFPLRFGFPVLVILDGNGKRLHTQNTAYLEEGEGYSKKKLLEFFNHWTVRAITPETYKDK